MCPSPLDLEILIVDSETAPHGEGVLYHTLRQTSPNRSIALAILTFSFFPLKSPPRSLLSLTKPPRRDTSYLQIQCPS